MNIMCCMQRCAIYLLSFPTAIVVVGPVLLDYQIDYQIDDPPTVVQHPMANTATFQMRTSSVCLLSKVFPSGASGHHKTMACIRCVVTFYAKKIAYRLSNIRCLIGRPNFEANTMFTSSEWRSERTSGASSDVAETSAHRPRQSSSAN